jgi:GTPase Era involved in 16S rRNA processing
MSMMGELTYFLEIQVKQLKEGAFLSQTKYIQDMLKKFGMKGVVGEQIFSRVAECTRPKS